MKTNVGAFDGAFRTLIFVVTIIFAVMTGQWGWTIPGLILFATAVVSWCPIYAMTGMQTGKQDMGY